METRTQKWLLCCGRGNWFYYDYQFVLPWEINIWLKILVLKEKNKISSNTSERTNFYEHESYKVLPTKKDFVLCEGLSQLKQSRFVIRNVLIWTPDPAFRNSHSTSCNECKIIVVKSLSKTLAFILHYILNPQYFKKGFLWISSHFLQNFFCISVNVRIKARIVWETIGIWNTWKVRFRNVSRS